VADKTSTSSDLPTGQPAPAATEPVEGARKVNTGKTYVAKPGEIEKSWFVVDAVGQVLGRLASDIAMVLMGKHRPTYTPHVDTGDYVIVVNAEKVKLTGKKWEQKRYTWYTGYPGQRSESAEQRLARHPDKILSEAVRRMLPKNKLGRQMLNKLKIVIGPTHDHQAQQPVPFEQAINPRGKKSAV